MVEIFSVYKIFLYSQILNCISSVGSLMMWDRSRSFSRSYFLPSLTMEQLTDTAFLTKKVQIFVTNIIVN